MALLVAVRNSRWASPPDGTQLSRLHYGVLWKYREHDTGGLRIMPMRVQDPSLRTYWEAFFDGPPEQTSYWEVWWSKNHTALNLIKKERPKASLYPKTLRRLQQAKLWVEGIAMSLGPLDPSQLETIMNGKKT